MRTKFVYAVAFTVAVSSVFHAYQVQSIAQARKHALQAAQKLTEAKQAALKQEQVKASDLQKVVVRQNKELLAARSVGLLNINPGPWHSAIATWYTGQAGINGTGNGLTYSGKRVNPKWVAAGDPRIYPIGSIVQVEFKNGVTRVYQVLDIGSMVKGYHIDIFDPSYKDAMKNGRQAVMVRILVKGR